MIDLFAGNEALLRFSAFLSVFVLCALGESLLPRRPRLYTRSRRWFANFSMLALATLLVRTVVLLFPLLGLTLAASVAQSRGWGLFHWMNLQGWLERALAVIALDFVIWAQHLASHHIPLVWRLHRVHHSDRDLDSSSALRFHPLEILLSMAVKLVAVLVLGVSVAAIILFEILLNATAMFNHANMALPGWLDRPLRYLMVTPDMHRIHHSVIRAEHDRNFGFCLSLWDRLFGTYKVQPDAGQLGMTIGLEPWQDDRPTRLSWALRLPFERK